MFSPKDESKRVFITNRMRIFSATMNKIVSCQTYKGCQVILQIVHMQYINTEFSLEYQSCKCQCMAEGRPPISRICVIRCELEEIGLNPSNSLPLGCKHLILVVDYYQIASLISSLIIYDQTIPLRSSSKKKHYFYLIINKQQVHES